MARRWITTCTCDYGSAPTGEWGIIQVRTHCPHHGDAAGHRAFTSRPIGEVA